MRWSRLEDLCRLRDGVRSRLVLLDMVPGKAFTGGELVLVEVDERETLSGGVETARPRTGGEVRGAGGMYTGVSYGAGCVALHRLSFSFKEIGENDDVPLGVDVFVLRRGRTLEAVLLRVAHRDGRACLSA